MHLTRIAVLGAGSIEHGPSAIAALANYFGERPFEIALWDADAERLDLMCRFARVCCSIMRSQHLVTTADELVDVLDGADLCMVLGEPALPDLSAFFGERSPRILFLGPAPEGAEGLEAWSSQLLAPEPYQAFHQLLRWIRSDEYPMEWLSRHEDTPLKTWLDRFTEERMASESNG